MPNVVDQTRVSEQANHQSSLASMCYEYAVLRTRAHAGIRLSAEDRRALTDLGSLLECRSGERHALRAFPVHIPAWLESPVVKLAGTIIGVSGGGLLMTAWSSIRPGTVVDIRIVGAEDTLTLSGTVRWSEPRGGRISLGVEFAPVPIAPEALQSARSFRQTA